MREGAFSPGDARPSVRRRRILFACWAAPAWGNTNPGAYGLHELLGESALDAALVHVLTEADVAFFSYAFGADFDNPRQLAGVRRCVVDERIVQRHAALADIVDEFA